MPEPHARRRGLLRATLTGRAADAALITSLVNVRYLTGLASSNAALLLPAAGGGVLATDSRYALRAEQDCGDLELVVAREIEPALAELAAGRGLRRIAFEEHEMTVARHSALTAPGLGLDLEPLGLAVEELRTVKDDGEIALLAHACAITAEALSQVLPMIRPGMTERELAVAVERAMAEAGAEKPAFDTIVASGPNGAVPHHVPGGRPFAAGDMITVDCGARYGGYHADMTRTMVLGRPADWQLEVYELVAGAQRAGIAAVRAGAAVADVDAAARDLIAGAGHSEHFSHGLGHGVGLQIHEAPLMGRARPGRLEPGVPITIEPGIYLPGLGGVRIEDTLVVRSGAGTETAHELLTATKTSPPGELLAL